ncbi:MAG: hypothetical protein M1820_003200 [Bogoriella megaspora]|nr:MAG: hypothetical protein M1820_003200 [Bogoriella megaspora]
MQPYLSLILFSSLGSSSKLANSYHDDAGVLRYVNPKIGTLGYSPNGNGGMIPSVSPPFGMTRWTPQTRENYISQCPYSDGDGYLHGFQATHQPAIWMGESGQVVLNPGLGEVQPLFEKRAHEIDKESEISTPYVYEVTMEAQTVESGPNLTESIYSPVPGGGQKVPDDVREGANGRTRRALPQFAQPTQSPSSRASNSNVGSAGTQPPVIQRSDKDSIIVALTATSHVGHLRIDFNSNTTANDTIQNSSNEPYVFVQATRANWTGHVQVDTATREISGSNPQRQDYALGPSRAPGFSGYFVSRFSEPFSAYGISQGEAIQEGAKKGNATNLGAYVKFASHTSRVEVRTGVSFVSIEQARRNLDIEVPDGTSFEQTVGTVKAAWLDKIGRVTIEGVNQTSLSNDPKTIWYTGLFHALQYPSDFSEPMTKECNGMRTFYSGYTDSVHEVKDSYYQSWSIWDTYRAEHSLLTLFAPERVNGMMRSLVQIFNWSGRLPMWANIVETNIMIGTHVDAVFANALERGFRGFDIARSWAGVQKNAYVPPEQDTELLYYDRESNTPNEVRAGLTSYMLEEKGYVPNDRWAESASRTLDYAFDDFAASVVASHANNSSAARKLLARSQKYRTIYNRNTTFMEAKNDNGTWAGSDQGWTEGDDWVYTFDVMHDPDGLAQIMGGTSNLKSKLDQHFTEGHNDHTNEPSHHVPYLYAAIGYPTSTQNLTREIAYSNYNATSAGLSGNEDLGQMSAWYVFSALGFYPVNPASDEYIVGAPFFEKVTIRLPAGVANGGDVSQGGEHNLTISAPGAPTMPFVKSLKVDGSQIEKPLLLHSQIVAATSIEFEMADTPQPWGAAGT